MALSIESLRLGKIILPKHVSLVNIGIPPTGIYTKKFILLQVFEKKFEKYSPSFRLAGRVAYSASFAAVPSCNFSFAEIYDKMLNRG